MAKNRTRIERIQLISTDFEHIEISYFFRKPSEKEMSFPNFPQGNVGNP